MSLRKQIMAALARGDFDGLSALAARENDIFRLLVGFTYDKESVLCWRAIEAVGFLAGRVANRDPERARHMAQRLLWMMREESGNNAWSAPEMLGEIVRNNPALLSDLAPIIESFHDEEIFRPGVLRAIFRIGEADPGLIRSSEPLVGLYIKDVDPLVRAYAVLLAGELRAKAFLPDLTPLVGDSSEIRLYREGELKATTVGKIAHDVVIIINTDEK